MSELRDDLGDRVDATRTVVLHDADGCRWRTWGSGRANAVLHAALDAVAPQLTHRDERPTNDHIPLRPDATAGELGDALASARERFGHGLAEVEPAITRRAIQNLKFGDLLPEDLATRTLAQRLADHTGGAGDRLCRRPRHPLTCCR